MEPGTLGGLSASGGFVAPPTMEMFVENWSTTGYARGFLLFVALSITGLLLTATPCAFSKPDPREPERE